MKDFRAIRPKRVLVVDDHAASRRYTLAALRQYGCSVKPAAGLQDAIRHAGNWLPCTVLTDWKLGDDSGTDVLEAVRKRWPAAEPQPRFLLMTGSRRDALPEKIADLGFDRVLHKPVSPAELARAVGLDIAEAPAETSLGHEMGRLFRAELATELCRLERLILDGHLGKAAGIAHRLVAGSAMAGEYPLERAFRALEQALENDPVAAEVAAAWLELRSLSRNRLVAARFSQTA